MQHQTDQKDHIQRRSQRSIGGIIFVVIIGRCADKKRSETVSFIRFGSVFLFHKFSPVS